MVLFAVLLCATGASAQQLLPRASFEFGTPIFFNHADGVLNQSGEGGSGSGSCFSYGIGGDLRWPSLLSEHFGLVTDAQFIYSVGSFTFDQSQAVVSGIDRKLLIGAGLSWRAWPFSARLGPWLSTRLRASVFEHDSTGNDITPANPASASLHAGVALGLSWHLPGFPVAIEATSHWDAFAGGASNPVSAGISLLYDFDAPKSADLVARTQDTSSRVDSLLNNVWKEPRIRFLANRIAIRDQVPLERKELHVTEYQMSAAPDSTPSIREWTVESYHLPRLGLGIEVASGASGYVQITRDGEMLDQIVLGPSEVSPDARSETIDLDARESWRRATEQLNIFRSNRIVATLSAGFLGKSQRVSDTLVLPAVDTSRPVETTMQHEYRFVLTDSRMETLDSLLSIAGSKLDAAKHVTVKSFRTPAPLRARIDGFLAKTGIQPERKSGDQSNGVIIEIDD